MKILDRYILRRFLLTLVFALVSFILIVVFVDMVGNLGKFIDKDMPMLVIAEYYVLFIPYIVTLVLPIAMLLASMFSVGQMARYNELIAIRSTGIPLTRILRPVLVLSFLVSLAALGFGEKVAPRANQEKSNIEGQYLDPFQRRSGENLEHVFFQDSLNRRIFIGRFTAREKTGQRVTIQTYRGNTITERIDARQMAWRDSMWVLRDGFRRSFTDSGEQAVAFDKLVEPELDVTPERLFELQANPEDLSYSELKRFIRQVIRNGGDPRKWQVELYFKLSSPFASFILVLFGAPLASNKNRSGAIFGLIMSLAIYLLYFGLSRLVKTLGEVGALAPEIAGWLTNGAFLMAGFVLLLLVRR